MPCSTSVVSFSIRFTTSDMLFPKEGISIFLEKIKFIMLWPTPRNVYEVISFMGLAGYYRWFIKNFSWIGYPITYL